MKTLLLLAAFLPNAMPVGKEAPIDPAVSVEFAGISTLYDAVGDQPFSVVYTSYKLTNRSSKLVSFAVDSDHGRFEFYPGMEASIELLTPDTTVWRTPISIGRDGASPPVTLALKPGESAKGFTYFPEWLLVDLPAETQFRLVVKDKEQRTFRSPPYRLHDGKTRMSTLSNRPPAVRKEMKHPARK